MTSQTYLAILFVVVCSVIAAVDIVLTSCKLPTISQELRRLSAPQPWIPLTVGVVIGHLFF